MPSYNELSETGRGMIDEALQILNELVEADRDAVQLLVEARVPCNDALADHATVQVHDQGGRCSVGVLGVLNGILGADDDGRGYVCAVYDDQTKKLVRFGVTPPAAKPSD